MKIVATFSRCVELFVSTLRHLLEEIGLGIFTECSFNCKRVPERTVAYGKKNVLC